MDRYMQAQLGKVKKKLGTEIIINIQDREFSSVTGWWSGSGGIATINSGGNGLLQFKSNSDYKSANNKLIVGRRYRIKYEIKRNGGTGGVRLPGMNNITIDSTVGIHEVNCIASAVYLAFQATTTGTIDIDIDNVSCKEII